MTDAEKKLWWHLRHSFPGTHFRRQAPVGPFYADFACHSARIIVEVDGSQHMHESNADVDNARSRYLVERGYRVLRFWNGDVLKNIEGVVAVIRDELAHDSEKTPHPRPLPTAARGEGSDWRDR